MRILFRLAAVLWSVALIANPKLAAAQVPDVPTPDTLGANFNIDSVGVGTPADYDFLEGRWTLRFQSRGQDGKFFSASEGTWHAFKSHEGKVAEDEFSLLNAANGSRSLTLTYRVFSERTHQWQMSGVSVTGGSPWATGITWSDANNRYAIQHYGNVTVRIRYYEITPNHFRWRADATSDGGKTWLRDYWKLDATRVTP